MWSPLDAEQLRARFSGQFRIVALAYLGGGGLAAFCLMALLLLVPAAEVVREVLSMPLQQLFEQLLPSTTPPVVAAFVEPLPADTVSFPPADVITPETVTPTLVPTLVTPPVAIEPVSRNCDSVAM